MVILPEEIHKLSLGESSMPCPLPSSFRLWHRHRRGAAAANQVSMGIKPQGSAARRKAVASWAAPWLWTGPSDLLSKRKVNLHLLKPALVSFATYIPNWWNFYLYGWDFQGKRLFLIYIYTLSSWQNAWHWVNAPSILIELNVVSVFRIFQWLLIILKNPFRAFILACRVLWRALFTRATSSPPRGPQPHQGSPLLWTDCTFFPVLQPSLAFPSVGMLASTPPGRPFLSLFSIAELGLHSHTVSPLSWRDLFVWLFSLQNVSPWKTQTVFSLIVVCPTAQSLAQRKCSMLVLFNRTKPGSEWQTGERRAWS